MAFLKKDMNFKLLFIIVFLLALFAVFSVYYQTKLEGISTDYDQKTSEFEKVTAMAVSEEYEQISQMKERALEDKAVLEEGYNELKRENEVLKGELASAKTELGSTKAELQNKNTMFDLLQTRFKQVEDSLIKANDDLSRLSARVRKLCSSGCSDDEC